MAGKEEGRERVGRMIEMGVVIVSTVRKGIQRVGPARMGCEGETCGKIGGGLVNKSW